MAQSSVPMDRKAILAAELPRYSARRLTNNIASVILLTLTLLSVTFLILIVGFVLVRGISTIFPMVDGHISFNIDYFTQAGAAPGQTNADGTPYAGGVANGIVGTLEMLLAGAVIAIPIGLGTAIYLSEYGIGRWAEIVRFVVNLLAGLPSVLVGLFIWALLIHGINGDGSGVLGYSGFAGALALAVIIIPIVASSVESILKLVPTELREAGYALGLPKWRVVVRIVLPTVGGGVATGILLALARAAGETAPLILTVGGANQFVNTDLGQPMSAMTLQIYNYATSAYKTQQDQAWGNALVLVALIAMFSAAVRFVTSRKQYDN